MVSKVGYRPAAYCLWWGFGNHVAHLHTKTQAKHLYISAQSLHTPFFLQVWFTEQLTLYQGCKHATNQLDVSQCIATLTAKSSICFRPNQLLTLCEVQREFTDWMPPCIKKFHFTAVILRHVLGRILLLTDTLWGKLWLLLSQQWNLLSLCQIQILFAFDNTCSNLLRLHIFLAISLAIFCSSR